MFSLLRPSPRTSPTTTDGFYGWRIVAVAGLALGLTGPGQTIGVSVFVDPIIGDLAITRSTVSALYLVGTLTGALALPVVGRLIDGWGVRRTMSLVAAAFGLALIGASQAAGVITLTLAFIALRMLGQGSLTLTATTSVAFWFERRRGTAVGITSAAGQGLMSVTPVALAATIAAVGWRNAWIAAGAVILLVLAPLAAVAMRDRPQQLGQTPDGDHRHAAPDRPPTPSTGYTRREAMRTGMFWAIAAAICSSSMIGTGLTFHQISILADRGFTAGQAAAVFVPITVAGITATFAFGWLVDRIPARAVLVITMSALAGGMIAVQHVTPGAGAILYATMIGTSGGAMRTLEGAVVPNLYGTRHLGSIRGAIMFATVTASAFGPLVIAVGAERLGSYPAIINLLLVVPAAAAAAGLLSGPPSHRTSVSVAT